MAIDPGMPIRVIALAVPGARQVLDHVGLDYCCSGDASLAQACDAAGLSVADTVASLDDAARSPENVAAFHDWEHESRDAVAAHIVEQNYPVERVSMADTQALLAQVTSVHGSAHPELREIEKIWSEVCRRLHRHIHEEQPEIDPPVEGTKKNFAAQHADLVELMHRIRRLARSYVSPEDGCDALRAVYRELEAFEADLHEHVLLADSVLFRKR